MRGTGLIVVAMACMLAGPALAQDGDGLPHENGFMIRLSGGPGYNHGLLDSADVPVALYGFAGSFDVTLGGIVTPGLAIHGGLWGSATLQPTMECCGDKTKVEDSTLTMGGMTGGFTFWSRSINLYFSINGGLGSMSIVSYVGDSDGDGNDDDGIWDRSDFEVLTRSGGTVGGSIGKEWMISKRWGVGFNVSVSWVGTPYAGELMNGFHSSARFSATFD